MSDSVVRQLILKDLRLHRLLITLSLTAGAAALALIQIKREVPVVLGSVWFFVALIVLACMLPISNIINERKKNNLAFMMSLPVSSNQYAMAKMGSTFGMFLVPWLALVAGALSIVRASGLPHGIIPMVLVLAGLVLVGFSVIASVAIVSESEGWVVAATIACNSCYGVVWYLIIRVPETARQMGSPVAIWSTRILTILAAECSLIALSLGLTFFFQSKKRNFI